MAKYGQTGPAALGVGGADPAVVGDDDLLDQGEAQAGPAGFGREERPEHRSAERGIDTGTVVRDADAQIPGPRPRAFDHIGEGRQCTLRARFGTDC